MINEKRLMDRSGQKKYAPEGAYRFAHLSIAEAIAAINGAVITRLERNFAGSAAFGAHGVEHLALATVTATSVSLTGITAGFAALRLIGEALFSEKLLLTRSEGEFLAAVFADDCLVLIHEIPL